MDPRFKFSTAARKKCKASIMIEGLTGSGKSGLALEIGKALASDFSKVFAIDTENKSLDLFDKVPCASGGVFEDFKVGQLTADMGFGPSNYVAFRNFAISQGAEVVIKDSISHAWQYKGGVLDLVAVAKTKSDHYAKDKYAAWGDEDVVKEKNELLQLIRSDRVHVITTVRVKEKMEYGEDDKGKKTLISLGEQQIQQADLKYEPDLVLHMISPGDGDTGKCPIAKVVKTRYAFLKKDNEYEFTPALLKMLKTYLEEGVDPKDLLEQQRQDYIGAVKEFLDTHKNYVPIWAEVKKQAGYADIKLEDLKLEVLKSLYIQITS